VNTFDPTPKFSGKERDEESQLDYFGARYYDREQYRFISVDPVISRFWASYDLRRWNLYAYCGDNPVVYVDLNGESYLVFNRTTQTLSLYSNAGALLGRWNASNNVYAPHYRFKLGTSSRTYDTPCQEGTWGTPGSQYGTYGFMGFDYDGTGMGLHSGAGRDNR
jgi:RHS repeat-associated protein